MMSKQPSPDHETPYLYLAPLRGLTDHLYRDCFCSYFKGFDCAIAPFINPQRYSNFNSKHLADILPENNTKLLLIPQILHTHVDDFIHLCERMADLGYTEVNWNLGCPMPMVAGKKRGSGFLPYPDEIISFLDTVVPRMNLKLSIKTRLGYGRLGETAELLPRLNDYPLKEIIIHARLGKQLYKGQTNPDHFDEISRLTRHQLVYNGDIIDLKNFRQLQQQLPYIKRWMIGRGAIADPFLAASIKTGNDIDRDYQVLRLYHDDLYRRYSAKLSGASHILGRMKQIWQYLFKIFPATKKQIKTLNKANSLEKYHNAVSDLFDSAEK